MNVNPRILYGARFPTAHFTGLKWLNACKNVGMCRLKTPAMSTATEISTLATLMAKPEWSKSVLNIMPTDSPQDTMQKKLNAITK